MPIHSNISYKPAQEIAHRTDPSRFVLSISLTLFALTLVAVLTMHLALRFNWQVL